MSDVSTSAHERRPDTGLTTAQLGLGLFIAADAMFYGALYSSYALLRTAADIWEHAHQGVIAGLGGLALLALAAGAIAPRVGMRPYRNTGIAHGIALLALAGLCAALAGLGAPPAASTYYALVHLFAAVTALHALGMGLATLAVARRDASLAHAAPALARRRLLSGYAAATALFWAIALALALVA